MDKIMMDLTFDIYHASRIIEKVKDKEYAERLYDTLSKRTWVKGDSENSLSFRGCGEAVATVREIADPDNDENYLDYYSSGSEGTISEEVVEDMHSIGWIPKEYQ